jgi:mono/diheme cytochrome c family protein
MVARTVLGLVGTGLLAAGLVGCGGPDMNMSYPDIASPPPFGKVASGPLFNGAVVRASKAYPISGGTLLVTRDGSTAVAADPDRAQVFLVDLKTHAVRSVATLEDDEVGRVTEGEAGQVYVVARRGGAVLRIDVATGTQQRMAACNAPRGVAYDAASKQVHVACASGLLVSLDASTGAVTRKVTIDDDLRDVLVFGSGLLVTRFRSAELLYLDSTGKVTDRAKPQTYSSGIIGPATLAYRATPTADGGVVVVHQQSSDRILGGSGTASYYGGNCGGSVADTFVTTLSAPIAGQTSPLAAYNVSTLPLGGAVGPLDVAVGGNGKVGIVSTGNSWLVDTAHPTLGLAEGLPGVPPGGCWDQSGIKLREGEPVAVAFDAQNRYVVQYREPAKLVLETTDLVSEIRLSTESRADTGLAMFYMNTSGGVACASCHPEGGVDGHVWQFADFGARVTQPLEGQVSKRAPFHWNGDLTDWPSLVGEVMMKRMSLPVIPSAEQNGALLGWLDTIANRLPPDGLAADAIERGRATFQDASVGCTACHAGATYTDNLGHQVGTGGVFITPTLIGVGSRAPLLHNGCAENLSARFGTCGGGDLHGKTSQLTPAQRDDLITFLRSL